MWRSEGAVVAGAVPKLLRMTTRSGDSPSVTCFRIRTVGGATGSQRR